MQYCRYLVYKNYRFRVKSLVEMAENGGQKTTIWWWSKSSKMLIFLLKMLKMVKESYNIFCKLIIILK